MVGALFLTGVLGAKGPVGTWETYLYDPDGATVMLCPDDDGTGYAKCVTVRYFYDFVNDAYCPGYYTRDPSLTRDRKQIIPDDSGQAFDYAYDPGSLTLTIDRQALPYAQKKRGPPHPCVSSLQAAADRLSEGSERRSSLF